MKSGLGWTVHDWFAIQNLIHEYPRRLDAGDIEGVGTLFAHASVHFERADEPVVCNPEAITRIFREFLQLYDGKPRTRHMICNVIVTPEGPTSARATSTVLVVQAAPQFPLQPIITGDYADQFEKVNDSWRFSERRITNDLFGDLSAHGRYAIGPDTP